MTNLALVYSGVVAPGRRRHVNDPWCSPMALLRMAFRRGAVTDICNRRQYICSTVTVRHVGPARSGVSMTVETGPVVTKHRSVVEMLFVASGRYA